MLPIFIHAALVAFFSLIAIESSIGYTAVMVFVADCLPAVEVRIPFALPYVRKPAFIDPSPGIDSVAPVNVVPVDLVLLPSPVNLSQVITPSSRVVYSPPEPTFSVTEGHFRVTKDLIVYVPPVGAFGINSILSQLILFGTDPAALVCPWTFPDPSDTPVTDLIVYEPKHDVSVEFGFKFLLSAVIPPSWTTTSNDGVLTWLQAATMLSAVKLDVSDLIGKRGIATRGSSCTDLILYTPISFPTTKPVDPFIGSIQSVALFIIANMIIMAMLPMLTLLIGLSRDLLDFLDNDERQRLTQVPSLNAAAPPANICTLYNHERQQLTQVLSSNTAAPPVNIPTLLQPPLSVPEETSIIEDRISYAKDSSPISNAAVSSDDNNDDLLTEYPLSVDTITPTYQYSVSVHELLLSAPSTAEDALTQNIPAIEAHILEPLFFDCSTEPAAVEDSDAYQALPSTSFFAPSEDGPWVTVKYGKNRRRQGKTTALARDTITSCVNASSPELLPSFSCLPVAPVLDQDMATIGMSIPEPLLVACSTVPAVIDDSAAYPDDTSNCDSTLASPKDGTWTKVVYGRKWRWKGGAESGGE